MTSLPLLKRDGGFVRAGYSAELDELRALRDQSRRVIAGLQLSYAEDTGVRSLKIKHNNVLGYFIEVTALNAGPLTEGDEAKAKFIHRQTMANAMRFTTTELSDLETRIANAAGEALAIELAAFEDGACSPSRMPMRSRRRPTRWRSSTSRRRWPISPRNRAMPAKSR
jgi:DNA mismatch repair protein MutS